MGNRIISSDNHVFEPPDLWTSRVDGKFRDRAPHIVREEDGGEWWYCDGARGVPAAYGGAEAGARFNEPEKMGYTEHFENVRPGGYIPEEHVKDLDVDGVDVSILYPSAGLLLYGVRDSELLSACCRTYNDWIAEFCKPFPNRLKGIGMINLDDIQEGVGEIERCAKMGFVGAMISVYPPEERSYRSLDYDPVWAAAQDLEMPLALHIGTNRASLDQPQANVDPRSVPPAFAVTVDNWVRMSLAHMILSGVFERYPKLQVGSVEMEVSWAPHFLDRLDYTYAQRPPGDYWHRYQEPMLPSDYFHRNVFISFQEDALGVRDRHIIGVDNLLWGADYPHFESTFPHSQEVLEKILADCSEEEKAKIVGGNAARIYHLD